MGNARFDPDDWKTYAKTVASAPRAAIYTSHGLHEDLNPKGVMVRESRDSPTNPESTPIIVAIDVTGSMGMLAETIAKKGLGLLFQEIYDRKPVTDPHVMFAAIGDAWCDQAPFQVSQFEADLRLVDQLTKIFIEGGGGGNGWESYNLPWYFASQHTSIDSIKRGQKGFLFTVGDEPPPPVLEANHVRQLFGDEASADVPSRDLLASVEQLYHVFHVVVEEGNWARSNLRQVMSGWQDLLGERVLRMADHTKLAEIIVSTIQVVQGMDKQTVASSWSGDTSLVVSKAIDGLSSGSALTKRDAGAVVLFD